MRAYSYLLPRDGRKHIERLVERGEVAEHELSAMIDEVSGITGQITEQITGPLAARGKSLVQDPGCRREDRAGVATSLGVVPSPQR